MKNLRNWIIGLVAIVAVLVGGYFVSTNVNKNSAKPEATKQEQVKKVEAFVVIHLDDSDVSKNVELAKGETALDATKAAAEVVTSGEGETAFITSINGREADASKNEFWELVINGENAQVGAGGYKIQDDDKIEWRISIY